MRRYAVAALVFALATTAQAQTMYRWVDKAGRVHYSDQLPPPDARSAEQRHLTPNTVETSELPYAARKAAQDFPVTLYTSPDCTLDCDHARELLKRRGVPYSEVSVRTSQDFEAYKKVFKSEPFVPSVSIGSQTQKGYEAGAWNSALDAAGYPGSVPPGSKPAARSTAPSVPPQANGGQ